MPPLVGIAVKTTEPPLQIDVVLAEMDTEGVTDVTVIINVAVVAH